MDKLPNVVPASPLVVAVDNAPDEHDIRLGRASGNEYDATLNGHQCAREPACAGLRCLSRKGA